MYSNARVRINEGFIMKNMLRKKYAELYKEIRYFSVVSALSIYLAGCSSGELVTNTNTSYDMIDKTNSDDLEKEITQVLDVPGKKFKLVVNYRYELPKGEGWTITSNKLLSIEIKTEGLTDEKVYINNMHTDITICSYYSEIDGIIQDVMDNKAYNSLSLGFSLSDSNPYVLTNQIEGQNKAFVQEFRNSCDGVILKLKEGRLTEAYYLHQGVYANKITSIIDLIIVKGDETSFVSVPSELQIAVWPYVKIPGVTNYRYYYLDSDGMMNYDSLSEDEYNAQKQANTRKLTK